MEKFKNLTVIPYVADYAEFAARTRAEILKRKDADFIVAVDLPQGHEEEIQKAVRSLPETSLLVDALGRGIPITPTSAPVEAVRSFLEYGYEMHCIDASLPVAGSMSDYEYFIRLCRLHGPEKVVSTPEQFGISKDDIFRAWAGTATGNGVGGSAFTGLPGRLLASDCPPFDPAQLSPYQLTRLRCMAMHLKKLLQPGIEVLFVCSRVNVNGILSSLSSELPSFDDSYQLPVKRCRIPENKLMTVSREIPFLAYTYELFRDTPFDREKWIRHLYMDKCGPVSPQQLTGTIEYAFRLALADCQVFPDLYNLSAAAKYFMGDAYAHRIYEKAISYPPSRDVTSNCSLTRLSDYNFNPLSEVRVLTLKSSVLDKPLPPISRGKRGTAAPSSCYYRFTRTDRCLQAELDLMKYLRSQFRSSNVSECESMPVEFTCGLKNGIDYRQTIRHNHLNRVYVGQPVIEDNSCYILDYREQNTGAQAVEAKGKLFRFEMPETSGIFTHVFFDKNYPWVGTAVHEGYYYNSRVMVAFMNLPFSPTKIYSDIHSSDPLASSARLGLKYAKQVVVFSDRAGELAGLRARPGRLKIYPLSALPGTIREKMRTFEIVGYRYDDRPGD